MRLACAAAVLCLACPNAPVSGAEPPKPAPATVIRAGTLIDGVSAEPRRNQVVVVRGNRIESVGDTASAKVPDGARVVDLSGATVLPGLIDSHTHIFLQGEDPAEGGYDVQLLKHPAAYRAARAAVSARRALEQGFTTIRDVETEGAGYGDVGIKEAIEAGYIPGPRMFVVTRAISTTGGYPLEGYAPEIVVPKGAQIVDGPVEARKAAREQLDNGADWIKVYMTHRSWLDRKGNLVSQPTLTLEEIRAITDEAHGWGRKSRLPRLQRHRAQARARRGLRLDRARARAERRGRRPDGEAGHVVLPDAEHLLRGLGARGDAGRRTRPQARRAARTVVHEGAQGGREDRLRDGRRRLLVDGADRAGVPADGRVRDDAHAGDPGRDVEGRRDARPRRASSASSRRARSRTSSRWTATR